MLYAMVSCRTYVFTEKYELGITFVKTRTRTKYLGTFLSKQYTIAKYYALISWLIGKCVTHAMVAGPCIVALITRFN